MGTRRSWMMIIFIFALGLVIVSQLLTYLIRLNGGFYFCNQEIAFSLPMLHPWWEMIIAIILFFLYRELTKIDGWNKKSLGLVLIIAGATQNLIDRLLFGCVVDFIPFFNYSIFNLGDIAITLGALSLILGLWPNKK